MDKEASLRRELEDAFAGRAQIYRRMLEELEREIGPERAEAVMMRALERRGRDPRGGGFVFPRLRQSQCGELGRDDL